MPAHQKAYDRLARDMHRYPGDRQWQDRVLDMWLDYRDRATEWDADQWGIADLDDVMQQIDREHASMQEGGTKCGT